MSRMESFEKIWAERHGVPAETMVQYRFKDSDSYRLPDMAAHYRTHCAALDYAEGCAAAKSDKFTTITQEFKRCLICRAPAGHGGLPCPKFKSEIVNIHGVKYE